jgi:hypothetical protein
MTKKRCMHLQEERRSDAWPARAGTSSAELAPRTHDGNERERCATSSGASPSRLPPSPDPGGVPGTHRQSTVMVTSMRRRGPPVACGARSPVPPGGETRRRRCGRLLRMTHATTLARPSRRAVTWRRWPTRPLRRGPAPRRRAALPTSSSPPRSPPASSAATPCRPPSRSVSRAAAPPARPRTCASSATPSTTRGSRRSASTASTCWPRRPTPARRASGWSSSSSRSATSPTAPSPS